MSRLRFFIGADTNRGANKRGGVEEKAGLRAEARVPAFYCADEWSRCGCMTRAHAQIG
jgi:hypothetical protein